MWKSILKMLGKSAKKATDTVGKSMEFVDDIIEKEPIVNAVEGVKEATGDIVEKAGTAYQKTKDTINETLDSPKVKALKEKGEKFKEDFKEKIVEQSETMKNVMDEGEKIMDKFFGMDEEE